MPAGLDLGGVVVVLGVLDPARAEGQLVAVFEELVAGAVGAYQAAVFRVTYRRVVSCQIEKWICVEGVFVVGEWATLFAAGEWRSQPVGLA